MSTESDISALADRAARLQEALGQLNARIATLAHVLNVSLATEEDLHRILAHTHPAWLSSAATTVSAQDEPHRRRLREQEELRGLLALRCDMMAQAVAELGLPLTQQLVSELEARREREGMAPNADGFHLRYHLDKAMGISGP
jgi:hypothetical protein